MIEREFEHYFPCPQVTTFLANIRARFFHKWWLMSMSPSTRHSQMRCREKKWWPNLGLVKCILDWDHALELSTHWNTMVNVFFRVHINVAFIIIKHHKMNTKSSIFVRFTVIWRYIKLNKKIISLRMYSFIILPWFSRYLLFNMCYLPNSWLLRNDEKISNFKTWFNNFST